MQIDGNQCGAGDSVSLGEGIGGASAGMEGANIPCGGGECGGDASSIGVGDPSGSVSDMAPGFIDDVWAPPTLFGSRPARGSGDDDGIGDDDEPFDDDDDDDFFPDDDDDDDDEVDDEDDPDDDFE